jgi:predicted restriction endonuclease
VKRTCPRCARAIPFATVCESCGWRPHARGVRRATNAHRAAQAAFRRAVLDRAGHRCEATVDGHRCPATTGLEAHHLTPVAAGGTYTPDNGVALCRAHHLTAGRNR